MLEFQPSYSTGLTIAVYVGMLVGALFRGLIADVVGRRLPFNISLFISPIFTIVAGVSPNWVVLGLFICLSAFGAGENLVRLGYRGLFRIPYQSPSMAHYPDGRLVGCERFPRPIWQCIDMVFS